jgi:hypothetical protein
MKLTSGNDTPTNQRANHPRFSDITRLQSILEQAVDAGSIDEIDFAEPS